MGWNFRKKKHIPGGLWLKCPTCGAMLQRRVLSEQLSVCNECDHHFKVTAKERVQQLLDEDTFVEIGTELKTSNPLDFDGYEGTSERSRTRAGLDEAAMAGYGKLDGISVGFCALDFAFVDTFTSTA